ALGDPRLPLAVQAFSRSITAGTGSDDILFLREGVPALFFSRSSLSRFYPQYHTAEDTPDRLSPVALHSSGRILEAAVLALDASPPARDGPRDYLLWRTSLLTQRLLAAVAVVPALGLILLAVILRRRDRRISLGAGLLFLPLLSAAVRFQPVLLLGVWPLGLTYGALVALPSPRPRLVLFWLGALPAVLLALVFAGGWISFGVTMPAEDALPLLVSGSFAAAGYALGRNGLRPAPVEPVDEPPGPGKAGKE
ncbi:MAG: M28 family peptidase, partial [Planctomycetes bacterium]|nr:M28 family peptidase [Planctomycetota bacterium]